MSQSFTANFYTFSSHDSTIKLNYYPHAPGPLIQGQSTGPRFEYQGPEGSFTYPDASAGRENVTLQEDSVLGPQINVVLIPTVDAKAVKLTLCCPLSTWQAIRRLTFTP